MQPSQQPSTVRDLVRVLGPWMGTALVIGTVIGSGIFKKPQVIARDVPEFGLAILAWVVVGILTFIGSLALAEVAVLLPRAGGNYVFLREAYGRWAGFLWGWVEFWIIRSASIAALATIFTESLHDLLRLMNDSQGELLTFWGRQGVTVGVITVLALINARGTTLGGGLQVIVTTVKVATLATIALLPFVLLLTAVPASAMVRVERLQPIWPLDWWSVNWSNFGAAMVGALWAYHGWMNITPVAEEVRNPSRNIPLALVLGTMTVMALYVSANVAYYFVVARPDMMALQDRTVAGEFAFRLFGDVGLVIASAAVMISVFGSLNGNLLVGPRLLFAMGRDGLAPRSLARLHPSWQTPALAGLVLAGWSILLIVGASMLVQYRLPVFEVAGYTLDLNLRANTSLFDVLTDYAIFGATAFETMGVAALFVLRPRSEAAGIIAPYRCPLFPILPAVYVLAMGAVLVNMFWTKAIEAVIAMAFIAIGALIYAILFGRRRA